MNFVRHGLLAVQFFTRIPVTGRVADWVGFSPAMLRASAAHLPAVGWLVGGVATGVFLLVQALLVRAGHGAFASALVAAVLSTLASVLLTGAFHEDGLADVADGLGGSYDRERALDIMKDSRVGAFGVLALVLAMALKFSLLGLLAGEGARDVCKAGIAILVAHVLSRLAPLGIIRVLPHVGDTARSKSKPLADQISLAALAVAVLWSIPAMVLAVVALGAVNAAAALAAAATAWLVLWRLFQRRLQGFTGDCLGATQQVCELALYLALAVAPALPLAR